MRLTDEQLMAAAIKLCEIRGEDPHRIVGHGAPPDENGVAPMVLLHSPAWRFALVEITELMQIAEAIDSVMEGDL